jgi:group I intron endonuclease
MTAGVYKIENIVTGESYIGSSTDIKKRWYANKSTLNTGRHNSSGLQQAWNTYGVASFKFSILCITDPNTCRFFEGRFITVLKPAYNSIPTNEYCTIKRMCKDPNGYSFTSPEGVLYEGIKKLYPFCKEHGLTQSRMHDLCTGKNGVDQHRGWRLSNNPVPKYDFVSPDNVEYSDITDVKSFEKEHGLPYGSLAPLCSGKLKETLHWVLKGTKHNVDVDLLSPDGELYEHVHDIPTFASEHGLQAKFLYPLVHGLVKTYHGWTNRTSENIKIRCTLISPDGTEYKHIVNLADFAREHKLHVPVLYKMKLHGEPEKHRGWRLIVENPL